MDEKQLITEQDKLKDISRNIVVATSSIIPGIGGVLSLFLDKYLPNSIEKRRDDFLLSLPNDLEQFPTHIVEKLAVSEGHHLSPFGERFIRFIFQPREINETIEILNNDE